MKKYFLLAQPEEDFPEQFNSHMFLVMEAILMAKKLNRVFVLPDIHSHPRDSTLCENGETDHTKFVRGKLNYPFESLFDIEFLKTYVEVITFEEFSRVSRGHLSHLYVFGADHTGSIHIYGKNFSYDSVTRLTHLKDVTDTTSESIALTGCRRKQHTDKRSPNWHTDPTMDYWEIRSSLRYTRTYLDKADAFIKTHLPARYLAVHWRRGDRAHPELGNDKEDIMHDRQNMERMLQYHLIQPIQSLLRSYKLEGVFLATNSGTQWHLDYLKKHLPIVLMESSGKLEDLLGESMIEQMICVKAQHYFSSPYLYEKCSSFSRWIIDERRIAGTGKNVSYQTKMRSVSRASLHRLVVTTKLKQYTKSILKHTRLLPLTWKCLTLIRRTYASVLSIYRRARGISTPSKPPSTMNVRGALFENNFVTLTTESLEESGAWHPYLDGMAQASDHHLIQKVYELLPSGEVPVFFDVGANTGSFSLLPSSKKMRVFAFEPSPRNYQLLNINISLNGLTDSTKTFNIALGKRSGTATLHIPKKMGYSGLSTLGKPGRFNSSTDIVVPVTTLDEFTKKHSISHIDFIKIDTEGSELHVLQGGSTIIQSCRPTMLIEFDGKNTRQCGYDPEEITKLLASWDYTVNYIDSSNILCTPTKG